MLLWTVRLELGMEPFIWSVRLVCRQSSVPLRSKKQWKEYNVEYINNNNKKTLRTKEPKHGEEEAVLTSVVCSLLLCAKHCSGVQSSEQEWDSVLSQRNSSILRKKSLTLGSCGMVCMTDQGELGHSKLELAVHWWRIANNCYLKGFFFFLISPTSLYQDMTHGIWNTLPTKTKKVERPWGPELL